MTLTISTPVRIAALCALAAALTIGGGLMLLGHKDAGTLAAPVIVHHPFGPGVKRAASQKAAPSSQKPAPSTHAAKRTPAKPVHATPKQRPLPSAERAALAAGLPVPLAEALGRYAVVVVELYQPRSKVDGLALAEAKAGAALASAGFLPLDVVRKANVQKLTLELGQVLPVPGLLVYTRPARLAARFDGFVDKETVAQAAQNAAGGS